MPALQGYMDFLTETQGDAAYDTSAKCAAFVSAAIAGVDLVIWEKTVEAQQFVQWGHGVFATVNQGYMWFAAYDKGTEFARGLLSLAAQNAARTKIAMVKRMHDLQLHSVDPTDETTVPLLSINEKMPLPVQGVKVIQDSKLQLRYTIEAALAGASNVEFSIPITRYMI